MQLSIAVLLLAQLVHCQGESPITSGPNEAGTPTSVDTTSPSTSEFVVTPITTIEQPANRDTSVTSKVPSPTSEGSTFTTSVILETSTSATGTSSSSTTTNLDDETEITTTARIKPESTSDAEVDAAGSFPVPRDLTPDESVAVTALDIEAYTDLLINAPLSSDPNADPEDNVIALPACPVSGTAIEKRGLLDKPPKRPVFYPCLPTQLSVEVIYNYVPSGVMDPKDRATLKTRVAKQHAYFVDALKYFNINLLNGELIVRPATALAAKFTDHYFSDGVMTEELKRFNPINTSYRQKTRSGNAETLNVWIVEQIRSNLAKGLTTSGYSQFPEWKEFQTDGIVVAHQALRSENDAMANANPKLRGNTLVHEFGHWMGLMHTFGDSNCGRDDGFADTPQTSNQAPGLRENYQAICGQPKLKKKWINNYMSYSPVRGTYVDKPESWNPRSFTDDQRAAMFSRFFYWRSGQQFSGTFCKASRDLQRRAEQKATLLADLLLNNCSIAIQDVYQQDTIPLPQSVLKKYAEVASSLQANPTTNTGLYAPKTASVGTGTGIAAAAATGTGSGKGKTSGAMSLKVSRSVLVEVVAGSCVLAGAMLMM